MQEIFGPLLGLSFGITFSPEVLIVGLWIASQKEMPLKKAWLFFAGGAFAVIALLVAGLAFSEAGGAGPSWTRFAIRAVFGSLLLLTALHVVFKGRHLHKNIGAVFERPVTLRFAAILGLASAGLNVKVISLATSAGHLIGASKASIEGKMLAFAVFLFMSTLPFLLAALIASIRLDFVRAVMAPCERIFSRFGRWIVFLICLVLGVELWRQAIQIMP